MMKTWDYKSSLHFGRRHYIRQHLLCILAGTLNITLPVTETSQQRKWAQGIPIKSPLPERGLVNHSPGTERAEELPPATESQCRVLPHGCCQMLAKGEAFYFFSCSGKTQIINPWPLGATDGVVRCDGEAVPALLFVPSGSHLATAPQSHGWWSCLDCTGRFAGNYWLH